MNEKSSKRNAAGLIIMLLLAVIVMAMPAADFLGEFEILMEDRAYQQPGVIPDNIKIIAIDETTLATLGPYSEWDRRIFAELINKLNSSPDKKPRVIGLDVLFSGTNGSEGDKMLAQAVRNSENVVLASKLETDTGVVRLEEGYALQSYITDEITAYDELKNAAESGFTNTIIDDDGYVRRAYTYIDYDGKRYKSFSYAIAELIAQDKEKLAQLPVETEVRYVGRAGDFEALPMSGILDGSIPPEHFADSVVLIGAYEEGMRDSHKVPIDRSAEMYGVECHANAIWSFVGLEQMTTAPVWVNIIISGVFAVLFVWVVRKRRIRASVVVMLSVVIGYPVLAAVFFSLTNIKLALVYIPIGIFVEFLVNLLIKYVELQKKRADDMQKMLFSMADSMAEAIEGRTPYNANHTKNVARRCMEILEYINKKHKNGETKLRFTEKDKKQMYLAAMLHDIGKMDVPLEVMDKSTKLGHREAPLRSRLEIIGLRLRIDALSGKIPQEEADEQIAQIDKFLDQLGAFNCGRPLKDDEWEFVDKICASVYRSPDGEEIPFITREEADDLHIKAGTLSGEERLIMQSHVVYTDKILRHMHFGADFSDVRTIAANHHELLNAKGYPNGIGAESLDVMTRILTVTDIFDSLVADDRPYKKAKPIDIAFKILDEEEQAGKIDKDILAIAKEMWLPEKKDETEK